MTSAIGNQREDLVATFTWKRETLLVRQQGACQADTATCASQFIDLSQLGAMCLELLHKEDFEGCGVDRLTRKGDDVGFEKG